MTLKIAVFAPMPSESDRTATAVNPGVRRSARGVSDVAGQCVHDTCVDSAMPARGWRHVDAPHLPGVGLPLGGSQRADFRNFSSSRLNTSGVEVQHVPG